MSRYPEGLLEWVMANYKALDNNELAAGVSKLFDYPMTAKTMNALKKNHGLNGGGKGTDIHRFIPKGDL